MFHCFQDQCFNVLLIYSGCGRTHEIQHITLQVQHTSSLAITSYTTKDDSIVRSLLIDFITVAVKIYRSLFDFCGVSMPMRTRSIRCSHPVKELVWELDS